MLLTFLKKGVMWIDNISWPKVKLPDRSYDKSCAHIVTITFSLGCQLRWIYIDGGAYRCISRKKSPNSNGSIREKPISNFDKKLSNSNRNDKKKLKLYLLMLLASKSTLKVSNLGWKIV